MRCFASKGDMLVHLERCMYAKDIDDPVIFETIDEAVKEGYEIPSCCDGIRERLFNIGFVIKGPKADTVFHSEKHYFPDRIDTT